MLGSRRLARRRRAKMAGAGTADARKRCPQNILDELRAELPLARTLPLVARVVSQVFRLFPDVPRF
jgi:hypothetical protein